MSRRLLACHVAGFGLVTLPLTVSLPRITDTVGGFVVGALVAAGVGALVGVALFVAWPWLLGETEAAHVDEALDLFEPERRAS